MAKLVISNVKIFDGSGRKPFAGEVHVEGTRIAEVIDGAPRRAPPPDAVVIDGGGATLMPGLIEPHGHLSFADGYSLDFTAMPPEEHMLATVRNAKTALDCGYTSVFSHAAAKPRLDVVLRREIEAGRVPGPRYIACSPELTVTGGLGDANRMHLPYNPGTTFSYIVDGPDEIRRAVRTFAREGVDAIKLHLSGDLGVSSAPSEQTPMTDAEVAAAVEAARSRNLRVVAHCRSAESVLAALRHGIRIVNHANYVDERGLDALEAVKEEVVVIPAISITHNIAFSSGAWGVSPERAKNFRHELDATITAVDRMHERGIRVLPGGDYGFVYTPHGTYARDLWLFVEVLGFSPMETLVAATAWGGVLMGREGELGIVKQGALADLLLVKGDPLDDISILQNRETLLMIMKDGKMHKAPAPQHREGSTAW